MRSDLPLTDWMIRTQQPCLMDHCDGIVDQKSWGEWLDLRGVPMIPVVRVYNQPFEPDEA